MRGLPRIRSPGSATGWRRGDRRRGGMASHGDVDQAFAGLRAPSEVSLPKGLAVSTLESAQDHAKQQAGASASPRDDSAGRRLASAWACDGYFTTAYALPKAVGDSFSVFLCGCFEQLDAEVCGRQICRLEGFLDGRVFDTVHY